MSASALAAMALPVKFATPAEAKTPGSTYCYHGTCHRVRTLAETQALVGVEETIVASHYDDCSRDRYNPCGLTSSGERFHPERPDNTASPIYPDGTTLLVWSPDTERALIVRVNNAGPYWGDRKLDLSRAAAEKLGFADKGVAKVRVRVIKAPEPQEAKYVHNRSYPPVPGDIGRYASLAEAQTGMAVALALQASAASPLAPVTSANAFARQEAAEPLVAEAPQALGRVQVASFEPTQSHALDILKGHAPRQSRRQLASLSLDQGVNQSLWGKDVLDGLASTFNAAGNEAPRKSDVAVKKEAAKEEPAPRVQVAAHVEAESERASQHVARREKKKITEARSRKHHARKERASRSKRVAKSARRSQRARVAYAPQPRPRRVASERSAAQVFSMGYRAQSSSAM